MECIFLSQGPSSEPQDAHNEILQLKVDFFRKLGYPAADVKTALKKLGLNTDTNSVLGELVRNGGASPSCVLDESKVSTKELTLPPLWTVTPSKHMPLPGVVRNAETELRAIVIDGSNVAMSHGNKEEFSCRGIQLAVDFFLERGHTAITVFVPSWRKQQHKSDIPIKDQRILTELEKQKIMVFTPSRTVEGKRVVCYDDRYIVKLAYESDGVIVSNDTYRDLQGERPEWKKCIEERLLMYSFVNDKFMPPDDPLGRHGPSLDNFLRKKPLPTEQKRQLCPYDKKCTYGMKCKFYHPERANQSYLSLADELREKAQISTVTEERCARLSSRQSQIDHISAQSECPRPGDTIHREQRNSPLPGPLAENKQRYREKPRDHMVTSAAGGQCHKDWLGIHQMPSSYYSNKSHEYSDSGYGSFDSHGSEISHSFTNSHRLRPHPDNCFSGHQHSSLIFEGTPNIQSCNSGSFGQQQSSANVDYKSQRAYATYPPNMFPNSLPHQHNLPSHLNYCGAPPIQQNYWSDPFQGMPILRTSNSLPTDVHSSHSYNSCHQYQAWSQQPPPASAAFSPQRSELRKKLQSIFSPKEVDEVLNMFPDQTDPEKLAAKILNLKAQRMAL